MQRSDLSFVLKALLRLGAHALLLLVFFLITDRCYFFVQSFFIDNFSKIGYVNSIDSTKDAYADISLFVFGCYFVNFTIVKKLQLKEIEILTLLGTDLICLFVSTLVMIMYNNFFLVKGEYADIRSLNNISVVMPLIFINDWAFTQLRKATANKATA